MPLHAPLNLALIMLIPLINCLSNLAMLRIFSYFCQPSVCLLWRNVCLGFIPTFDCVVCLPGIELYELIVRTRHGTVGTGHGTVN